MTIPVTRMNILNSVAQALGRARSVLLMSHVSPDGDTLGSALAMAWALRGVGKEARLTCADPIPSTYGFLPGVAEYAAHSLTDEDCAVAVDASDAGRLGSVYDAERFAGVPLIVIDHHRTNTRFGTINFVREASSTAELVLELLEFLGWWPDVTVATCLLAGLVTDTQGFRTTSTTADSFRAALRLLDAGADLHGVMAAAFKQRTLPSLKVWGRALQHVRYDDGVIWAVVDRDVLCQDGNNGELSSGLVNLLSTVEEALVALVFREVEAGTVEVGLRAVPGVDISRVAVQFGGGGHPQAAGCTVTGAVSDVVDRILGAVRRALEGRLEPAG